MTELTREMVLGWLYTYGRAWETQDSRLITALFTENAHYIEHPFEPAMIGREAIRQYWEDGAVSAQTGISFESTLWCLDGPVAIAHWQAEFTRTASGRRDRLDGVFRLSFQAIPDGSWLCAKLQEWWFVGPVPSQ